MVNFRDKQDLYDDLEETHPNLVQLINYIEMHIRHSSLGDEIRHREEKVSIKKIKDFPGQKIHELERQGLVEIINGETGFIFEHDLQRLRNRPIDDKEYSLSHISRLFNIDEKIVELLIDLGVIAQTEPGKIFGAGFVNLYDILTMYRIPVWVYSSFIRQKPLDPEIMDRKFTMPCMTSDVIGPDKKPLAYSQIRDKNNYLLIVFRKDSTKGVRFYNAIKGKPAYELASKFGIKMIRLGHIGDYIIGIVQYNNDMIQHLMRLLDIPVKKKKFDDAIKMLKKQQRVFSDYRVHNPQQWMLDLIYSYDQQR